VQASVFSPTPGLRHVFAAGPSFPLDNAQLAGFHWFLSDYNYVWACWCVCGIAPTRAEEQVRWLRCR